MTDNEKPSIPPDDSPARHKAGAVPSLDSTQRYGGGRRRGELDADIERELQEAMGDENFDQLLSDPAPRTRKAPGAPAGGKLKGILTYNTEQTVSVDYNGNPASSIFDSTQTAVADDGKFVKVFSWYDNEWGFSNRMVDVGLFIAGKL